MPSPIWVFSERKHKTANQLQVGDQAALYLSGTAEVIGILTMRGPAVRRSDPIWLNDEPYAYSIPIAVDLIVPIGQGANMRDLKDSLQFITNKVRWATAFQSGVLKLGDHDFDLLQNAVLERR